MLLRKISDFKINCSEVQLQILRGHWPKFSPSSYKIGVLKLVPKIHKLVGPFTVNSWKDLKSRPIRGAEQDPMKIPSKALYSLMHKMLEEFKQKFPKLNASTQNNNFTVLAGCDDYLNRLSLLKLDPSKFSKTFIVSADFSDAFTET